MVTKQVVRVVSAVMVLAMMVVSSPLQAKETGGAAPAILSFLLPGVGEWSNSDFQGSYPFGECIVGAICFPFWISSIIDASRGNTDRDMRFEFWSSPSGSTGSTEVTQ